MMIRRAIGAWSAGVLLFWGSALSAQQVPHPRDVWGFESGADNQLADYSMVVEYMKRLDQASDRVQMIESGRSTLGRPLLLAFISSEENLRQLDRWKGISQRLARGRGLTDEEARSLAKEGRAVVWIDGGLHATERAHGQMMPELAWRIATEESEEMRKIRDNVIVLLAPNVNPDGLDIVADWWERNKGTAFQETNPPVLYHFYMGHDNNRDAHTSFHNESQFINRWKWHEWYPQITYNHHQTAPYPARIIIPPYDEPLNPEIPPLVVRGLTLVGAHEGKRFEEEGKTGVLSEQNFSMWMPDAFRYADYFHNEIGVMSETAHPSPVPRFIAPESLPEYFEGRSTQLSARRPSVFYPNPWQGGWSRFRDAVDYMITASLGVLDIAADLKEDWLFNSYRMGQDAIKKGEAGGPFAYVVPAKQWDGHSAREMLVMLERGGVDIHQATGSFTAGGKQFEAGDWVIFAGQPNRPWILTLMEPQDHPDDRLYPGGPPKPPYDLAGWTFPIQMGVEAIRVDEPFQASVEPVAEIRAAPGEVAQGAGFGYALTHRDNASFLAVNRLLKNGEKVSWAGSAFRGGGNAYEAGTIVVEGTGSRTRGRVEALAGELGLDFTEVASRPEVPLLQLSLPRVGLYKSWQANMDEGWTRWILEQWEFPVDTLHDADIRSGDLSVYDAIVLPDQDAERILNGNAPGQMPPEYVGGMGVEGAAKLKAYVQGGGTVVALDKASDFTIQQFGLPVRNVVADVSETDFFIPGSLIRLSVDVSHPLAWGMQADAAAFFVNSRAFEVVQPASSGEQSAGPSPVTVVARYGARDLLMSGWEVGGDRYLRNRPAVVSGKLGQGNVVLLGFRAQFRGQPRGTFKLLFNALHAATLQTFPGAAVVNAGGNGG